MSRGETVAAGESTAGHETAAGHEPVGSERFLSGGAALLIGRVRGWCIGAVRLDTNDEPLRSGLWRRGRPSHVEVVHHLVERPVRVVCELHRAVDGGVGTAGATSRETVQQERQPRVAQHVTVFRRSLRVLKTMSSPSGLTKITAICADPSAFVVARTDRWGPARICLATCRASSGGTPSTRGSLKVGPAVGG
jgi:hypothetical protein